MSSQSQQVVGVVAGVVVGVDGSEQGYAAVRYAAREAQRLGVGLDAVHVLPASVPIDPTVLPVLSDLSLQSYGSDILARARTVASETVPTLDVRTHLCSGGRTEQLLSFGERADLMVIGNRASGRFDHIWTGGTVTGIASAAACPVVVVPECWESGTHGRIAVGVKSPGRAGELFDKAFPLAAERCCEIVVLHAWRLEGVYDDIIANRTLAEDWQHEQSNLIEDEMAAYRATFPDVPVHVFIRHEEPAHALVRVSHGADRLLIQRPAPGRLVRHLGRVARAVLRDARCPVEVLPAHRCSEPTTDTATVRSDVLVP